MSELQPSDTRSPTQASTNKSQGLDELNQIVVRQALAPKQQLFSETEPADSHKVLNDFKHVNLHHKERLYELSGRRQRTPGSFGTS